MARELLENLRRLRLLIALAVGDGSYGSGRDAAAGFVALSALLGDEAPGVRYGPCCVRLDSLFLGFRY